MSNNNGTKNSASQLCLINLYFKLKGKLEMKLSEDESDFVNSNAIYSASPEEITQRICKMVEICFNHYGPEIQQSNLENSSCQNSKSELATEYESMIQKLEAEVRSHIRLEQQLKLHADSLQAKIEEKEKLESSSKQKIQNLNDELRQVKNENQLLHSELNKYKDNKNDLEKKLVSISIPKKINHTKGEKTKTRIDAVINISELSNKTQSIPFHKYALFESKQIDQDELRSKQISRNNLENNNKVKESKISISSKCNAKENNFMMSKSQSNFSKRNIPDQKTVPIQIDVIRKRNSECIGNEVKESTISMQKTKGALINSNNALKRLINGKTQNSEVYKTINHINEAKEILTERQKGITKELVEKNHNSIYKVKFNNTKRESIKQDKKSNNKTDSNRQSTMNYKVSLNRKEEENCCKNDECNDSVGREANICEQNIDVINRRARSITYQFGVMNSKLLKPNSSIFSNK